MQIDMFDLNSSDGFYVVDFPVYEQTLNETEILQRWDLGAVGIIYGMREGAPIWILDNPQGQYAVWVEDLNG